MPWPAASFLELAVLGLWIKVALPRSQRVPTILLLRLLKMLKDRTKRVLFQQTTWSGFNNSIAFALIGWYRTERNFWKDLFVVFWWNYCRWYTDQERTINRKPPSSQLLLQPRCLLGCNSRDFYQFDHVL